MSKMGFNEPPLKTEWKNHRHTATVGGKVCNFRSDLEHKMADYLELLKQSGHIKDWLFENTTFKFPDDTYLVDFDVLENNGKFYYIECKGYCKKTDVRRKIKLLHKHRPEVRIMMVFQDKRNMAKLGPKATSYCWRVCLLKDLTQGII